MKHVKAFIQDESGATAIEYALIAAAIGVTLITALTQLGTALSNKFNNIKGALGP